MNSKRDQGFTLVELMLALGLIGIIFIIGTTIFILSTKSHKKSSIEYKAQADMRIVAEKINSAIRDSTATFVLYKENATILTKGWNYIIMSDDNKSIIEYKWDENLDKENHIKSVIIEPQDDITYKMIFEKDESTNINNLINYKIERISEKTISREIESELTALNALQVIDKSKDLNKKNGENVKSNALAYRSDPRPADISDAKAAVALVLDTSGSMSEILQDEKSRLYFLQQEASNLIEGLSKNPNVHISLNPFASTANKSEEMMQVSFNKGIKTKAPGLLYTVDKLVASGGTNTGDGMRRAYYRIKDFNENSEYKDNDIKNFMVILVDGDTTFASTIDVNSDVSKTKYVEEDGGIPEKRVGTGWFPYYGIGYYGHGSNWDKHGRKYVEVIGKKIKEYEIESTRAIRVYIIGYSNEPSTAGLKEIAKFTTGDESNVVQAGSSEALKEIFDAIQYDINESLWHIGGPQ